MSKKLFILVFSWLLVVNIFGVLALNRFNLKSDDAYAWIPIEKYDQNKNWSIVNLHSRWDSNWYLDVVKNGYQVRENDNLSNIVFFPVYPFIFKMVAYFLGNNLILAGWLVSVVFLILSCLVLFKLIEEFYPKANSLLAVFLLLIFPTSFFLNAVYTESIFLFLSLTSFYFGHKKKYFYAGIFGFLAALTRITGVLLFPALLVQFLMNEGWGIKKIKKTFPLFFIPAGTALFFLFHWMRFGDFLLFFRIESAWGRSFSLNKDHFIFLTQSSLVNFSLDVFYLIFGLAVALYLASRKQYSFALYMATTIGVAVFSGTLMSIGRYILVLFPIFIVGASIKNEIARYVWILISAMLMTLNICLFVNWYWAG